MAKGITKVLLVAAGLAAMTGAGVKASDLSVYCDLPARNCRALVDAFADASFGNETLDITIFPRGTGPGALAASDIFLAAPGVRAAQEDMLAVVREDGLPAGIRVWARRPFEQSGGRLIGVYAEVPGFVVNTDVLRRRQLREPACWADLLRAEFRSEIRMGDPTISATAYRVLASLVQIFGEDAAFDYMKRLEANLALNVISDVTAAEAVAEGEAAIAIVNLGDGIAEAARNDPVKLIAPCEGTGYEPALMAILADAPHMKNAMEFYAFSLSAVGQSAANAALGHPMPSNTNTALAPAAAISGPVRLIDYDFGRFDAPAEQKRLKTRWTALAGPSF